MKAILALEDGTVFHGKSFGATGETYGEVVFNTSMTGYQEVLTDPSYKGQIVTMTYPLIGNYGCNDQDLESYKSHVEGFIVREYSSYHSNWRASKSLHDFLSENHIIGIQDIDTRALTRRLRNYGVMKGIISTGDQDENSLINKVKDSPGLIGLDLVKYVTCKEPFQWLDQDTQAKIENRKKEDRLQLEFDFEHPLNQTHENIQRFSVVALDCGIKYNILRELHNHGCDVMVVSATTSADEILAYNPDGIFLSNGPGDPEGVPYVVETVKELIGRKPIFGICLGHQILGLAFEGKSFKLKFGHRGTNQPVKNLETGKIEITTQNHGFCIDADSLEEKDVKITHINLNDNTLEGIEHKNYPVFSVQYHPEASPGPHDAKYLFKKFINMMKLSKDSSLIVTS
ncbi:glutamine-hydrolyzing carbamoyl-phosphate synthase small subunit [Candidatus Poribacteria bacterium]|nr:glutamine-hydrolyzing carbamoyl-phosphate synthase small subunit [Candidatus Poribacteria bacterium]